MSVSQLIGIELSNDIDYSAVTCYCTSCKQAFNTKFVQPGENVLMTPIYKKCPKCGAEFEKHIISE